MNMTIDELKALLKKNPALRCREDLGKLPKEKELKYKNKPERLDGHYFKSQEEIKRYCELKLLKAAGIIKNFVIEPKYELDAGITYKPDFGVEYWDHYEVEEVKGKWTEASRMRVKMFRKKFPDIPLKIIRNGVVEE